MFMKALLIKTTGKSIVDSLVDKLMLNSHSEVIEAFGGIGPTEYFRELRNSRSKQKTF